MTNARAKKKTAELRKGFTTGACATAAAAAAFEALLTGHFPDPVAIRLPKGWEPCFALSHRHLENGRATAGVIKDAGDDPDVTHGAEIRVTVEGGERGTGIQFRAGEGVGTVTRPGLPVPPGEPAINPVPRAMMTEMLRGIAAQAGAAPDLVVTISIPGGERIAEKTLNGRLGIKGGLSILGTTGIVVPYSCSAWIDAIRSGLSVARAEGLTHVAASTGRTSERAVRELYGLPEAALIEMGDFAGGLLKEVKRHPVRRLTLAGGFAKLAKLGQGAMDLHSKSSRADLNELARLLGDLGARAGTVAEAREATTAAAVLELAQRDDLALGDLVAERALAVATEVAGPETEIEVIVFDRGGKVAGRA